MSRILGIRRDIRIEIYLLLNIIAFSKRKNVDKKINRLKENSRSFIEYYKKRKISVGFKGLDLIACRILIISSMEKKYNYKNELAAIDNEFSREYLLRKLKLPGSSWQQRKAVL